MVLKSRYIRFVFAFLILSGVTLSGLIYLYLGLPDERSCEFKTRQVVAVRAATTLMSGTVLTLENVQLESIPERFLPPNPVLFRDLHKFEGRRLSIEIEAGAMILDSDFE